MILWEDLSQAESFAEINAEIEKIGKPTRHLMPSHDKIPNVWTQSFKVWEYATIYLWLERLRKKLNRPMTVMDFGCGRSPFPEYLASKGFDAWGIDNDENGFISTGRKALMQHNINTKYWIGEVKEFNEVQFDAIVSCSALEHVVPVGHRNKVMYKLESLLKSDGKMLHIIDFYFPEKKAKQGDCRINVYDLCQRFGYRIDDLLICPGFPKFNFESIRKNINFIEVPSRQEARIAFGDDI